MSDKSTIEWTDATWNPTVGCSIVSPGCTNCYAMKVANGLERRFDSAKYRGLTKVVNGNAVWTGEVRLDEAALLQPLKWKRGRRIFVNSMSDLFHEALSDAHIDRVFAVMALCPQHTFQVLTKRAERMHSYLARKDTAARWVFQAAQIAKIKSCYDVASPDTAAAWQCDGLPNVWLGISAERQKEADERIPHLLDTPAAVRFISAEPLLGPLDLNRVPFLTGDARHKRDALTGQARMYGVGVDGNPDMTVLTQLEKPMTRLDWVIVGGESGTNARPMHPDWARSIIAQCEAAGVAMFFKQWGEYGTAAYNVTTGHPVFREFTTFDQWVNKAGTWVNGGICLDTKGIELKNGAAFMKARDEGCFPVTIMHRVGKKAAGRSLDGKTHSEFPEVRT